MFGYFATDSLLLRSATTLSCMLIALGFVATRRMPCCAWWIVAAFALSFAGDYVLGHWGGGFEGFVCGVGLFLVAHLCYVAYSLCCGRMRWWLLALLVGIFGVYYFALLLPAISDTVTSVAVLSYIIISCLSMAAAVGLDVKECGSLSRALYIIGIASLLFSDLLIAQKRFLHDGTLYALMMPTYFASQILVTASLLTSRKLTVNQ